MKQQTCKFILEDGTTCLSTFHSAMWHKPKKEIKRNPMKKVDVYIATDIVTGKRTSVKLSKDNAWYKPTIKEKKKPKTKSRSSLIKDLDAVFSQYIRLKDAKLIDGELMAMCVTSGEWKPWKQHQNGHFYTRGRQATRWDEMNCHVQSYRDNVLLKGNYIIYTKYMIDRYGREAVDELEFKSLNGHKISTPVMREMIEDYKKKVADLLA